MTRPPAESLWRPTLRAGDRQRVKAGRPLRELAPFQGPALRRGRSRSALRSAGPARRTPGSVRPALTLPTTTGTILPTRANCSTALAADREPELGRGRAEIGDRGRGRPLRPAPGPPADADRGRAFRVGRG